MRRGRSSPARVDVAWRNCDAAECCAAVPAPGELVIRLVREPVRRDAGERAARSCSVKPSIDTGAGAGVLATIYVDRVERMAELSETDVVVLLGRAIAHELGHLLLATNAHSTSGLMRAQMVAAGSPAESSVRTGSCRGMTPPRSDGVFSEMNNHEGHEERRRPRRMPATGTSVVHRSWNLRSLRALRCGLLLPGGSRFFGARGAEDVAHRVVAFVAGVLEERLIRDRRSDASQTSTAAPRSRDRRSSSTTR